MRDKQETRPVGQPGGPCGKVSGLHFQYSTNRPPHQNPGAILAPMLSVAERRPHGKRDDRIGAALLALLWPWEAEQ
jgi:hypothetical protein